MQNFHVFGSEGFFFLKTPLRESNESVNYFIGFILVIVNLEVILRKFLNLLNFFGAQVLCIQELFKVIVIRQHKYFILTTFQIVLLYFKDLYNCQELLIVRLISNLSRDYFFVKSILQSANYPFPKLADLVLLL